MQTTIRLLQPGDEWVVERLAEREPRTALLADPATVFAAAFADGEPIGFAFGYVLPRRHGDASIFFVYEIEVDAAHRRRGTGRELMRTLAREARARGAHEGFVLTEPGNDAANALYASLDGERTNVAMWDFRYVDD